MNKASSLSPGGAIVLGLLLDGNGGRSGYELQKQAAGSVAHFWPVTKAHVYGELPKLEAAGLVSGREVEQSGYPDKRIYTATRAGRIALERWLKEADLGEPKLRHPTLLRVFFGEMVGRDALRSALEGHAAEAREALARYRAILERSEGKKGRALSFRRLSLRHGVRRLEADLAWVEDVRAFMSKGGK